MPFIKFTSKEEADKGYPLILHSGTVVYTKEKGSYIIPETSIVVLQENNVKFELTRNNGNGKITVATTDK